MMVVSSEIFFVFANFKNFLQFLIFLQKIFSRRMKNSALSGI